MFFDYVSAGMPSVHWDWWGRKQGIPTVAGATASDRYSHLLSGCKKDGGQVRGQAEVGLHCLAALLLLPLPMCMGRVSPEAPASASTPSSSQQTASIAVERLALYCSARN